MRKSFSAIIIVLLAVAIGLYATEKEVAQAESLPVQQQIGEIKLELVYQKPFDEIIGTKGFPPPEIKAILNRDDIRQEDREWLLNSLRIEIAKRKKILYTNDGEAVQLPNDLKSISTSDNLKYMIIYAMYIDRMGYSRDDVILIQDARNEAVKFTIEWRTKWEAAKGVEKELCEDSFNYWIQIRDSLMALDRAIQFGRKENKQVIVMETETGKILWKKEGSINTFTGKGNDIVPPSYVSDDGKTAIAVPGGGPLQHLYNTVLFYDEKGIEKKKVGGLDGLHGCHDLSADGEMFCTLIQIKRNDTKVGAVAAYDKDGNELWITEIPGTWPDANPCIAVSPNHKYVAASIGGTSFLNENGIIINTYNHKTYYPGFSFDGRYLITGTVSDTIYFINTTDNKVLWQKSLGGHSHKKPVMTTDGRLTFFVSLLDGQHPANFIDKKGNIIWNGSHELKNAIGISPNGNFFVPSSSPDAIIYYLSSEAGNEDQ